MYNIPIELTELINSNCISNWERICALIQPFPEQHMIIATNAPNNTIIIATKIFSLLGLNLSEFKVFNVINDIYNSEKNHGIYAYNNKYFYMDMKRIRYDDYKYMLQVLESIIYSQRITINNNCELNKIVILVNNFDQVLQQYLSKFIKYTDTLSVNVTFIYIGTGIINYYINKTKLKGLCISMRCISNKMQSILSSTIINNNTNALCNMLYNFTDGDIIKSWLILQIFNNDVVGLQPLTSMQLFEKYILPNMPILMSIYEMLILLKKTVISKEYSITPIMNKLYILHSYPDMNICRIINIILKLFIFINSHDSIHCLYLSQLKLIDLTKLCNTYISMDTQNPYVFNDSILILRGFITKLLLFL